MAGGKPLRTRVKTVKGSVREAINPVFNCELWYPVSIPSTTNVIKFTLWDQDTHGSELIACVLEDLSTIKHAPRLTTGIR
jgi:hypothetical protein